MAAAKKTKASDKQSVSKKLVAILKKRFGASIPKKDRPILETMLYGICLENASDAEANVSFARLESDFHDLNEVRVSSVRELESVFAGSSEPEWRALRTRYVLQYVFENRFAFDFEALRRKTLDLATKQLKRIKYLSPFVRAYTLQTTLGSHLIPVDDQMCDVAVWFGLAEIGTTPDDGAEVLKAAVRKSDVPLFCYLLRCLASDPNVKKEISASKKSSDEATFDVFSAPVRLTQLLVKADARAKATTKAKGSSKKSAKSAARTTSKSPAAKKSSAAKKTAVAKKKSPVRKKAAKTRGASSAKAKKKKSKSVSAR